MNQIGRELGRTGNAVRRHYETLIVTSKGSFTPEEVSLFSIIYERDREVR